MLHLCLSASESFSHNRKPYVVILQMLCDVMLLSLA